MALLLSISIVLVQVPDNPLPVVRQHWRAWRLPDCAAAADVVLISDHRHAATFDEIKMALVAGVRELTGRVPSEFNARCLRTRRAWRACLSELAVMNPGPLSGRRRRVLFVVMHACLDRMRTSTGLLPAHTVLWNLEPLLGQNRSCTRHPALRAFTRRVAAVWDYSRLHLPIWQSIVDDAERTHYFPLFAYVIITAFV